MIQKIGKKLSQNQTHQPAIDDFSEASGGLEFLINSQSRYQSFLHSRVSASGRLFLFMITVVIVLWGVNIFAVYQDYQARISKQIEQVQQEELNTKQREVETVFRSVYEHIRTMSLLPSIRRVTGANRYSEQESVVEQGRLSLDTHQTIQQIYRNLNINIELSEIYFILNGFDPNSGQVPFFMYDGEISSRKDPDYHENRHQDSPEEYELDEYRYYLRQLAWYESNYPFWQDSNDINQIPAVFSDRLRTCDNTQYLLMSRDDIRDTHGLLYSVPVFSLENNRFIGIISAVLRTNVLESILLDIPFLPITPEETLRADEQGFGWPDKIENVVLSNPGYDITIYDRRNDYLEASSAAIINGTSLFQIESRQLDVVGDSPWYLHVYLTPQQVADIGRPLNNQMFGDMMARLLLLVIVLVIILRFNYAHRRQHIRLLQMAHFDNLTGLPDRRMVYDSLELAIKRAKKNNTYLALMFLDVDDFGIINDTMSHRMGDLVLKNIAKRLIRPTASTLNDGGNYKAGRPMVARLGGDDFALIFENLPSPTFGIKIAEEQMVKFRKPMVIEGQKFEITVTCGMSVYPNDAEDLHELMASTDYALRHAMDSGSGNFMMFNDEMRRSAARQNRLLRDLPDAVRAGGFSVHYQPKQALGNDQIFSFEALMRWNHPELGFVSPVEFIPLLEQTGYIVEAGRWILEESCQQLKIWHDQGYKHINVSVNVSAKQLLLSDMVDTVERVLEHLDLSARNLILEITESLMIDNLLDSAQILNRIRRHGVRLAIDDFGTGYSSLTYLQGLPVDYLKLDKSMIDVIGESRGAHVTRATIDLAHGLGLQTIAEGVEDEEQRAELKKMGCDMIQGYLLSRPLPPEDLHDFLELSNPSD